MKRTEIFSGKSIEEAKAKAADEFGVSEENIQFTVLEEARIGLFGRVKSEAKIKAEYEKIEVEEPENDNKPYYENDETVSEVKEIPAEKIELCRSFLKKVLEKMEIECELKIKTDDGGIFVDIDSKGSGAVIGRRGETLDSLQYICSLVINRKEGEYVRVTLDSCGYREKREETLISLAKKISNKVLRSGRSTILEPMNPYERRIIHSTVAGIEGVNSKSIGDEPYRKVIVASDNPRKYDRNRRGGRGHGGRSHHEPRSLDLKTSFEKDYKKPKPEDDINAGLYGKIEF